MAAGDDGLTAVGLGQPLEAEHYNSRWQPLANINSPFPYLDSLDNLQKYNMQATSLVEKM